MADIALANSTYSTGTNDTASTLVNNVTATDAQQWNGVATAVVGIETILGTGTDLKGSTADLVARLAVEHNADGTQKTVTVAKGGTGATTLTDGAVLVGNGTGAVQPLALPSITKTLVHSGTAAADPVWGSGLMYQGPTSCATGSTRSHEGDVTVSANGNYSGIHFYGNFTLNSGVTMTVQAGLRRLVIVATGTITINGTITAAGAGGAAGAISSTGTGGTDQPGGGAGGNGSQGGAGGPVTLHGYTIQTSAVGGAPGGNNGAVGTQVTASVNGGMFLSPWLAMGSAGGGGSETDVGGIGGGSIVLIAPVIVLANTAVLNTSGTNGASSGVGSGGGGGGNVYMMCRSYTDNGATFTMTGGTGAAGTGNGGAGAAGVKQINVYA